MIICDGCGLKLFPSDTWIIRAMKFGDTQQTELYTVKEWHYCDPCQHKRFFEKKEAEP